MAREFTLGKEERLKSRKQTERLFREGKRFTILPFRIHYFISNTERTGLQFGVGVGTKTFPKATHRSRVKRMTREAYRLQKNALKAQLFEMGKAMDVFFIYTAKELPLYQDLFETMGKVLQKLSRIITTES